MAYRISEFFLSKCLLECFMVRCIINMEAYAKNVYSNIGFTPRLGPIRLSRGLKYSAPLPYGGTCIYISNFYYNKSLA